jgi:hypothetical protein
VKQLDRVLLLLLSAITRLSIRTYSAFARLLRISK